MVGDVHAEMSVDEYSSTGRISSPEDRRKEAAIVEELRRLAELEELKRQQEEAHRQTVAANRLAMRPLGERLLDSRCTACHALNVLDNNSKSPLAWRWTVERMRWFHGAQLTTEEARLVSAHLISIRSGGAGLIDVVIVTGLTFMMIFVGTLAWMVYRRKSC